MKVREESKLIVIFPLGRFENMKGIERIELNWTELENAQLCKQQTGKDDWS